MSNTANFVFDFEDTTAAPATIMPRHDFSLAIAIYILRFFKPSRGFDNGQQSSSLPSLDVSIHFT